MQTIGEGALALAMIAAVMLTLFGVRLAVRRGDRKRGILMVVAAAVLVANVVILTI
jgi:high-affinity Fe2+/Pb2+ permease